MAGRKYSDESKKKKPAKKRVYPIKYYIGDIPIREVNVTTLYIPERAWAKIATAIKDTRLSIAKAIAFSGKPCDACKESPVIIELDGQQIEIPRGLLDVNKQNSGKEHIAENKKSSNK